MGNGEIATKISLSPVVVSSQSRIERRIENIWPIMMDFHAWNPNYVDAQVDEIEKTQADLGGIVYIRAPIVRETGRPAIEFYCKTVAVDVHRSVVWFMYPKENYVFNGQEDPFRNFVDFTFTDEGDHILFKLTYFAQLRMAPADLAVEIAAMQSRYDAVTRALSDYCHVKIATT